MSTGGLLLATVDGDSFRMTLVEARVGAIPEVSYDLPYTVSNYYDGVVSGRVPGLVLRDAGADILDVGARIHRLLPRYVAPGNVQSIRQLRLAGQNSDESAYEGLAWRIDRPDRVRQVTRVTEWFVRKGMVEAFVLAIRTRNEIGEPITVDVSPDDIGSLVHLAQDASGGFVAEVDGESIFPEVLVSQLGPRDALILAGGRPYALAAVGEAGSVVSGAGYYPGDILLTD